MIHLTKMPAIESAGRGIRVNAVAPGTAQAAVQSVLVMVTRKSRNARTFAGR